MKYHGNELIEMTPDKWDGKSRRMLAWNDDDKTWSALICGYNPLSKSWICADSSICFSHCAEMEIPKEEHDDIENKCIHFLTNKINVAVDVIRKLKEENENLKNKLNTLRVERSEMANSVSSAVWKELMDRAEDIDGPVNTRMAGFGFNDISDLVLNKILEYKPEDKPVKRLRRMTYKEVEDWLIQCNGLIRIDNKTYHNIYFDCEDRNKEVRDGIEICGHKEHTWHEPMIEE